MPLSAVTSMEYHYFSPILGTLGTKTISAKVFPQQIILMKSCPEAQVKGRCFNQSKAKTLSSQCCFNEYKAKTLFTQFRVFICLFIDSKAKHLSISVINHLTTLLKKFNYIIELSKILKKIKYLVSRLYLWYTFDFRVKGV